MNVDIGVRNIFRNFWWKMKKKKKEKKKKKTFLTVFYIFHESGIKTFLKWSISKCHKVIF